MSLSPSRIVCAAIKCGDVLLIGARHYDSHMREQKTRQNIQSRHADEVQGFIDQHGNFYDRQEAWIIAEHQGQIKRPILDCVGTLYSENLY